MIEIEGLTKIYGSDRVVDDVSLRLESGTITAIVGTSGSGKSTLLRMINRLIEPDSGGVRLNGVETTGIPVTELRRRIGYVIQDHGLFPHWTVARNVATVPRLLGWDAARIEARVREMLALMRLDPDQFGARYPHELSGGQAQRVGVARALAARPDVLLMDEPFGALDPVIRHQSQRELAAIQRELGSTILLVTHDMSEALTLADRIAVMDAGRVIQFGTGTEIVNRPAAPFVRSLIPEGERSFRQLSLLRVGDAVEPSVREAAPGGTIDATASLADALSEMIRSGRRRLPVVGEGGAPVGIIDLDRVLGAGRAP